MNLSDAERILDLVPLYSKAEIKQTYRDLIVVWHPDRFSSAEPRRQELAERKTKELTQAYEMVMDAVRARVQQEQQKCQPDNRSLQVTDNSSRVKQFSIRNLSRAELISVFGQYSSASNFFIGTAVPRHLVAGLEGISDFGEVLAVHTRRIALHKETVVFTDRGMCWYTHIFGANSSTFHPYMEWLEEDGFTRYRPNEFGRETQMLIKGIHSDLRAASSR